MLRPYQTKIINKLREQVRLSPKDKFCVFAPTGCHAKDTNILMFDGSFKKVQDIKVGDLLMGKDSCPRKVNKLYSGIDDLYEILPLKSPSFIVNKDHVLHLIRTQDGTNLSNQTINIKLCDYLNQNKTFKHIHKLVKQSINFSFSDTPIDPYVLGFLLGDGHLKNTPTFTKPHCNATNYLIEYFNSGNYKIVERDKKNTSCKSFSITDPLIKMGNRFSALLQELDLYNKLSLDKFIPTVFKINSNDIQLKVLAGLLDSDGHLSKSGFDYISKSKQLSEDVVFLARSNGLKANISECMKASQNKIKNKYYRVSISGDCDIIPTLDKKAPVRKQKKDPLRYGFKTRYIGVGEYFGFELSDDKLYLTSDFFIHHNSGKSHLLAEIAQNATKNKKRTLIVTHRKNLLVQNQDKLNCDSDFYCAGLNEKKLDAPVIFGSIQTLVRALDILPAFDIILIDEAHRCGSASYKKLLAQFPNAIVIGFTATPYRLKGSGNFSIVGKDNFFTKMIDEVGITELVEAGFLSKLKSQVDTNITQSDFETLKTLDFDLEKAKELITSKSDYISVIKKAFIKQMPTRAIVFCCDIEHTESVANKLNEFIPTSYYHSKHKSDKVLDDFKSGKIKVLCNCEVFTEGFDLPSIDYVILLRPTKSTALYVQMVGRGLRVTENKNECIVLDFGGNIAEHGAINYIQINQQEKGKVKNNEPLNVCSACFMVTRTTPCEHCGAESEKQIIIRKSPEERIKKLSQKEIYSDTFSEYKIDRIVTSKYQKKYSSGLAVSDFTLRVDFISSGCTVHSEFLCLNHSGYARELACNKFRGIFGIDAPVSVDKALGIIPRKINYIKVKNTQKKGDKYPTRTLILVKELPPKVVEIIEIPSKIKEIPLVQDILKHFPNSQIII